MKNVLINVFLIVTGYVKDKLVDLSLTRDFTKSNQPVAKE